MASTPDLHVDEQELAASLREERALHYHRNRLVGPAGNVAAAGVFSLIVADLTDTPGHLLPWLGWMGFAAMVMLAAFAVPRFADRRDDDGVPTFATLGHSLMGFGWGALPWIDIEATADPLVHWPIVTVLFAVSSGVIMAMAGVNDLGVRLLVPTWILGGAGLLAVGQYLLTIGCTIFLVVALRGLDEMRHLWLELARLRWTADQQAEAHAFLAAHDPLTTLLNRHGLTDRLAEGRPSGAVDVLYLDLDRFKPINDEHGHGAGDQVLREVADRLVGALRPDDLVARLGGDEFVVVALDDGAIEAVADRLRRAVAAPIARETGALVDVTTSVGLCSTTRSEAAANLDRVLAAADRALYEAKVAGRDRLVAVAAHGERAIP